MLNFKGVLNSFPRAGLLSPARAKANAVFNFRGINLEFFMSSELGRSLISQQQTGFFG